MSEVGDPQTAAAIPVGRYPAGIAIDGQRGLAYVANYYDGTVSVVGLRGRSVVETVDIGERPYDIVVDAGRGVVYVSQWQGRHLWRLDRRRGGTMERIDTGYYDGSLAFDPLANRLYLIEPSALAPATIKVIDGDRRNIIARYPVGAAPLALAVDITHRVLYVLIGAPQRAAVVAIESTTLRPLATFPVGPWPVPTPCAIAVDPAHPLGVPVVYAVHGHDDAVYAVECRTHQRIARLEVGSRPRGIAIDPEEHVVYVTNWGSNSLTVIDPVAFRVAATARVGRGPCGVAVDPTSRLVCATNNWDDSVTALKQPILSTGSAR